MQVRNFEDLEIWKDARALTREIYQLTRDSKFSKDFALRDQIRRAAVSIMSNIAEGFERGGNQEFIQFLYVAKASCGEVRSQLYVALDQSYVAPKDCDDASKSFQAFINHDQQSDRLFKAQRYKRIKIYGDKSSKKSDVS